MREIVVLGGGYGGILTAKGLGKQLKKNRDVHITLIDRSPFHTLLTELHEVAAGRVEEDSIKVNLKKIFAGFKNVDVVQDEILNIDFNAKTLEGSERNYSYEYLVIGTGSKPTFFGIEGAEQNSFTLWSYDDAIRLREQIQNMFRAAVQERNPQKRKEMLTFVVVGAGFTGVEMIGELAEYVQELCKEHYVDRSEVELYVVDMMDKILPILPDALIRKAEKRLLKLGVKTITKSKITGVKTNGVVLGDREISSRTVIWTAGVEGSDIAAKVDAERKGRARLLTNDKLQLPDRNEVYVVGDNIFYIPEGSSAPVPQMVENAEAAAPLIAYNIASDIFGRAKKSYKPTFHGMMVSIGSRYGVAYVGLPSMMFKLTGFMAMLSKHMINMLYLFQVCGFNKVYAYLLHEIFHVRNRRSFIGGYLSKRSPNFWLVPLRMFVGFMWLREGLNKVESVLNDPNKIFLIPAPANGDATAAASAAAEGTVQQVALPVWGWLKNIVDWSMDTFFYTSNGGFTGMATVFQTGMVCAEIIFGLMLIGGLFTAPVAIMTMAMGIMIWVSGMAPQEMLWYLFASVALIGGSGSTFGLDYYVYPWLKKVWRKIPLVKRFYLYAD